MATYAPFVVTPSLVAVAVAYRNERLIADLVLPRVQVSLEAFKYMKYAMEEAFTVPDTAVGRKGRPNQVEFTGTEATDATVDQALDDVVPNNDILNAEQAGMPDPVLRAAAQVTELLALRREKRTADLVFNNANYATPNKVTLSTTGQWSDYVNSDPIPAMKRAFDAMIMRPTHGVIGRAVATELSMHPKVCAAVFKNGTNAGIVPMRAIADLLELEDIYVGEGWLNTAKKGQPAALSRVWGKHAAFIHQNKNADTQFGTTFGFTAQWGSRIAGSEYDRNAGMRGGQVVRVGESVKELITANDLGYLFTNAVA